MKCIVPYCNRPGTYYGVFAGVGLIYCSNHNRICFDLFKRIKQAKVTVRLAKECLIRWKELRKQRKMDIRESMRIEV